MASRWLQLLLLWTALLVARVASADDSDQGHAYRFDRDDDTVVLENGAAYRTLPGGNGILDVTNGYATISNAAKIDAARGTIVLWVYPTSVDPGPASSTFITLRLSGHPESYLALSQGWWEPQGRGRLYFVVSAQDHMHCSAPYTWERATWTQLAVTWFDGVCTIYVNGDRLASSRTSPPPSRRPSGPVYVGSDAGSLIPANRSAHAWLDGLRIYTESLDERRVLELFDRDHPLGEPRERAIWTWLYRATDGDLVRPQSRERHAIFDEGANWARSYESIDARLRRTAAAGFTTYVPTVWHGRGAYFPTSYTQPEQGLLTDGNGGDPLSYLMDRAHARGIEVHPSFTVTLREDDTRPEFYGAGTPADAYDIRRKEFRAFMIDLIVDAATRYPVDGINLDYVRTMGICVSDACARQYRNTTGHDLERDYAHTIEDADAVERLNAWQAAPVDAFVSTLSRRLRAVRPDIVVSVDIHSGTDASRLLLEGRDSIKWLNNGWIDRAYDMQYGHRIDVDAIDAYRARLARPEQFTVLWANYDDRLGIPTPRAGDVVARLEQFSRGRWPRSGTAFYLHSMLSQGQIDALARGRLSTSSESLGTVTIP